MKTQRASVSVLGVLSLLWLVGPFARAQTTESGVGSSLPAASAASYYYVAKPGELTIQVNIWGDVQKPGRYEVPSTTDLVQLISYAGGPTREAKLASVVIMRFVRKDGVVKKEEISVNLEGRREFDEAKLILFPGDAVYIDYSERFNFRDLFAVVTTTALVVAAIAQVMYATNR